MRPNALLFILSLTLACGAGDVHVNRRDANNRIEATFLASEDGFCTINMDRARLDMGDGYQDVYNDFQWCAALWQVNNPQIGSIQTCPAE